MQKWISHIMGSGLPRSQQALLAALGELSCSPWKFDALWSTWPDVGLDPSDFQTLAQGVLGGRTQDTVLYGTVAFDDITIFDDVCGTDAGKTHERRLAYRLAYLTIRPMAFRSTLAAPPFPPYLTTEEQYLTRLAVVSNMVTLPELSQVQHVLEQAGRRYEAQGKQSQAAFCKQNHDVLAAVHAATHPKKGGPVLIKEAVDLALSLDDQALAFEFIVNWWSLYPSDLTRHLRIQSSDENEIKQWLSRSLAQLEPLAWVNHRKPGVGSAIASLTLLRLASGLRPPACLTLLDPDWLGSCQESTVILKKEWQGATRIPDDLLHLMLDVFVEARQSSRRL